MNEEIIVDQDQKADFSMPFSFPVRIYETDLEQKPFRVNNWHWHEELQFCAVVSGALQITVQNETYKLQTGDGIFINSGYIHMTKAEGEDPARYLCLNIHPHLFSFFHGSVMEQKYFLPYIRDEKFQAAPLFPSCLWQKEILKLERELWETLREKREGYELETYIHIMEMWKLLVLHIKPSGPAAADAPEKQKEIKQILQYIHKNFGRRILLEELAAEVHLSREGCCRLFKKMLNCTIFDYLMEYRIQKSMEFLEMTDFSVTRIAYDTGFSSVSYFIRRFGERLHMTPGEYRKSRKGSIRSRE